MTRVPSHFSSFSQALSLSGAHPAFTQSQIQLDFFQSTFSREATNGESLLAMTIGGATFRCARLGLLQWFSSLNFLDMFPILQPLFRGVSWMGALGAEVAAFRGTSNLLARASGRGISSAEEVFNRTHFSANLIDFALLKLTRIIFHGASPLLTHLSQNLAMVAGHQMAYRLHLTEAPQGSFAEQFIHAAVTNIQMGVGMALAGHLSGHAITSLERNLDRSIRSVGAIRFRENLMGVMSAVRVGKIPEESVSTVKPDQELVSIPKGEFIQGSQLRDISSSDEAPLRRVRLSAFRILKTAVTNRLWERYVQFFRDRSWAIIGREKESGRWSVLRRGKNQAELQAWMDDRRGEEYLYNTEDNIVREFEATTLKIREVIPKNALRFQRGFGHPEQPLVNVNWFQAVAAADGMGRLLSGVPGYLLREAEWEYAARGRLKHITVPSREFLDFIRGPQINPYSIRGTIPLLENFVQITNPETMEFGREVLTGPNHPVVRNWLMNGVLGAWNVFAGDYNDIWSSVSKKRPATCSVLQGPVNTFGLRGMNGNASEWVEDWRGRYEANSAPGEAIVNPGGPDTGKHRVYRGGDFSIDRDPRLIRIPYRFGREPENSPSGYDDIGFRFLVLF